MLRGAPKLWRREFWGVWDVRPDGIHIEDTKRVARVRDVPRQLDVREYRRPVHLKPKAFALRVGRAAPACLAAAPSTTLDAASPTGWKPLVSCALGENFTWATRRAMSRTCTSGIDVTPNSDPGIMTVRWVG